MTTTPEAAPHGAPAASAATPAEPAQATQTTTEPTPTPPAQERDWEAEAKKWEKRAKENGGEAKKWKETAQASETESERAVREAEERGRTSATSEFSQRLVRTRFDALAARRNSAVNTDDILEFADLSKFVGDDGEVNEAAIAAAVEKWVPEAVPGEQRPPSFDSGNRQQAPKGEDMNSLIRRGAGFSS